ncbi:MAG: M23 family metallopeptidase [Desulfobacterales bacterium]|jgi:murein DD-endopeptidase MepM/ murein hydrolase activator NlpD
MKSKARNIKLWIIVIGCLIIVLPVAWVLMVRLEGEQPKLELDLISPYIGSSQDLTITVSDTKSGMRKLWVGLLKDGKEIALQDTHFPLEGLLKGGSLKKTSINIAIAPSKLGFSDGEATLRMVAHDYSWRDWWKGNKTYLEKTVVIDTKPPEIEVLSRAHNINQGGAGLVIFRTSENCSQSGVQVGDKFFPGHGGFFEDSLVYLTFFALGYQQGRGTDIRVRAVDLAGNISGSSFYYHIRRKGFRKDKINISDGFLNRKLPEFSSQISSDPSKSQVEQFLEVNRDLRAANYQKIAAACQHPDQEIHWQGTFLRLPKSATRARFADHRTYFYKGRKIDKQVHLGIDLASVSNSPVPAANDGLVAFAQPVGIYGKTVVLDHGFGLFSMYSHLSQIAVKTGDRVSKGDTLGRTGSTGMAGGDHLHFSMLINDTFVNPVEWWDKKWIENNVTSKIDWAKSITQRE